MPVFEYKGLTRDGKNTRGTIDAENSRVARSKLKKDGIFVVELRDKVKAASRSKNKSAVNRSVNIRDLSAMTRQLASLIKAQIILIEALTAVAEQVENPVLKDALTDIKNMVNEGSSLTKALTKYPKIFSTIYVTMVEAGEMTGTLDIILLRLAEFTEAQSELNAKISSAMIYPIIMMIFTCVTLAGLFVFVIPKMTAVFESVQMPLPWYSQAIIGMSGFMVNYWMVVIAAGFGASFLFRSWKNSESGSKSWDRIVLKLPIVGKLALLIAVSRFTRTLATLLTGGVPMLPAMDIVSNVVDNHVLAEAIIRARNNIREGESIADPLKKSGRFPPLVTHMIKIGEKTGELEKMLTQVADSYDFTVKTQVEGLTSVLTPLMVILMGGIIGAIVFALMEPMFAMGTFAG